LEVAGFKLTVFTLETLYTIYDMRDKRTGILYTFNTTAKTCLTGAAGKLLLWKTYFCAKILHPGGIIGRVSVLVQHLRKAE